MAHQTPFPPPPHQRPPQVSRYGTRNDELISGSKTVFEFRGDAADAGGNHQPFMGAMGDLDLSGGEARESNLRSSGPTWALVIFGGLVVAGAGAFLALRSTDEAAAAVAPAKAIPVGTAVAEGIPAPSIETPPPAVAVADANTLGAAPPASAAPTKDTAASPGSAVAVAAPEKPAAPATAAEKPASSPPPSSTTTKPKEAAPSPSQETSSSKPKPKPKPKAPRKKTLTPSKAPRDGFGKLPPPPS